MFCLITRIATASHQSSASKYRASTVIILAIGQKQILIIEHLTMQNTRGYLKSDNQPQIELETHTAKTIAWYNLHCNTCKTAGIQNIVTGEHFLDALLNSQN